MEQLKKEEESWREGGRELERKRFRRGKEGKRGEEGRN